jgi:hypothetical protein
MANMFPRSVNIIVAEDIMGLILYAVETLCGKLLSKLADLKRKRRFSYLPR